MAQATRDLAKAEGLTVVLDEAYSPTADRLRPDRRARSSSSKAEALLGGGHLADGTALARALHEQKAGLKWLTLLVAPDAPNFADLGDAALGVTAPSQWSPQVDVQAGLRPDCAGFRRRFSDKFKIAPTEQAAAGYAGGLILAHAIEKAGTVDPARSPLCSTGSMLTTLFGRARVRHRCEGARPAGRRTKWSCGSGRNGPAGWCRR